MKRSKRTMFKEFLRENITILGLIGTIFVTTWPSFNDMLSDKKAIAYLLSADTVLAITVFCAMLKNEKSVSDIKERLEIRSLSKKVTRKESYQMLTKAVASAKKEIRIMTIDTHLTKEIKRSFPERDTYYQKIKKIAMQEEIVIYRIYGLPAEDSLRKDKIDWINEDLCSIKKYPNYHIAIFDWRKFNSTVVPLSLQIVDDSFINLVDITRSNGVVGSGEDICSEDKNIVQHFTHYYEIMWEKCDKLKLGDHISPDVLTK